MNRLSCPWKPSIRSPDPTPTSPVSVLTRTIVASKCRRGLVSQLALNAGASGRRWWLIETAAILCPERAGRDLRGRALMEGTARSRLQTFIVAQHRKAEKLPTHIEKRHWKPGVPWRDAALWVSMSVHEAARPRPLRGALPCREEASTGAGCR